VRPASVVVFIVILVPSEPTPRGSVHRPSAAVPDSLGHSVAITLARYQLSTRREGWRVTDEIRGALIAAVVSILIFWGSHRLATQAAARERRRKAIEDWYRSLSEWVDKYALPESNPDYRYNSLTSRVVLELSLTRKDRYLAWWMHEMAVALIMRRQKASHSEASAKNCSAELHEILLDTGEALTAWHHGELKGSDFHIPYALRNHARMQEQTVSDFAEEYKLIDFIKPSRKTWSRRWKIWVRMTDPEDGTKVLKALGRFTGLDAIPFT